MRREITIDEQLLIDGGVIIVCTEPMPLDPLYIIVPIDGEPPAWPPMPWPPIVPGCW